MSIATTPPPSLPKDSWLKLAGKTVAVGASTGAALISVFTALYSHGVIGKADATIVVTGKSVTYIKMSYMPVNGYARPG